MFHMLQSVARLLHPVRLASLLALIATALQAGQPSWAGGGSDNKASNPSNWTNTSGTAPGNSDHVVISTGSVSVDLNTTYGALDFSGGDIGGAGTVLSLGSIASSSWTGGDLTFSSGGGIAVTTGATLAISGASTDHDFSATAVTNNGTVNWSGGRLRSGNTGTFTNNGVFNDTASNVINNDFGGTALVFTNASGAQYNKSLSGTTTLNVALDNSGAVNVSAGELYLHGGGTSSGSFTTSGSGNDIRIDNGYAFGSGASLSGAVRLTGGSLTANGTITANGLSIEGGSLQGSQTFTGGAVAWTGGDWNATGNTTTLASSATLNISGTADHDFNGRAVANDGTVNWSGGRLRSGSGGSFTNRGTFNDSTATSTDINDDYNGGSTFANAGTLAKTGSGTTRFYDVAFNNSGSVNVHAGTLELHGGGTNASSGTITADAGASVVFSNNYTLSDASALAGGGNFYLTGGTLTASGNVNVANFTISAGTLAGTQSFNGGVGWAGGDMNTAGTTTIGGNSTLTISNGTVDHDFNGRTIVNSGTTNWTAGRLRSGNNGSITNQGTFVDSASSDINNDYGGTTVVFSNASGATYRKTNAGQTNLYVPLVNSGVLDVQAGILALNTDSTFNDGTTTTGAGLLKLVSGLLTANGTMTFSNFQIAGGTVTGNHTFNGAAEWSAGNFNSGSSTTTIGGTLTIDSSGDHDFNAHAFSNNGTINWSAGAGALRSGNGGQFTNNGTFNDAASNEWNNAYGSTAAQFFNGAGGSYNKSATGTTTFNGVSFVNAGTINVQAGSLELAGGGSSPTGARFNAASSAALRFTGGTFAVADGSGFSGNGSFIIAGGTVSIGTTVSAADFQLTGGTLGGVQTFAGGLAWTGGDMNNSGTTTIGSTGALTISGTADHDLNAHTFVNNGTVNWTGGRLRSGNAGTMTNNGTFNDSSGSTVNNDYGSTSLTFTNAAGGHYEKSGSNTSTFLVPFNNSGTVDVNGGALSLDAGGTIGSGAAFHGSGQVLLASGTFTATGTIDSTSLVIAGAQVAGTHTFTGTVQWSTGNFNTTGTTTIASGATLDVASSADHDFSGRGLVNNGTFEWTTGAGRLRAGNSATLVNNGTFNDHASSTINNDYGSTSLVFTNATGATYNKLGTGNTDFLVPLNSNGTVNVAAGGAILLHAGGAFGAGATFNGSGTTQLLAGTFDISGAIQTSNLVLAGGTITGTPELHGLFEFAGGALGSGATTTIDSDAVMVIDSSADHDLPGHALVNNGVINWKGGRIRGGNAATIVNNGTFNDLAAGTVNNDYGSTALTFTNGSSGLYAKAGSGTTTFAVPFVNDGTLAVTAGTIVFNGTFTNHGNLTFANGGIAQFSNPISFSTSTLAGNGTLNVSSVIAGGLVSPGASPGQLNLTGDLTLLSTSTLLIELGGTTQGTTYDFLSVGGNATLGGNLDVRFVNGFNTSILASNTFTVLTVGGTSGLTGAFANVTNGQRLTTLDGLGSFQVNYGNGLNSVTLTNFQAIPEPSTYALLAFGLATLGLAAHRRRRA